MSKRRRASQNVDLSSQPSLSKTARLSDDVDEDEDDDDWHCEPGTILDVHLRNFMCHQDFTYVPGKRLNFLCGSNGSGKSAVLTAIVFALGGSARVSNRGSSNKGFIRSGQQKASVEIRLWNGGKQAFRPELYGKTISVLRTITASGAGSYKLKNETGKVVLERRVKEELDKLLTAFGIQVENPIAVLNQDSAKSFLYKCDSIKLYDFFMRATQLEACKNDYTSAAVEKNEAESTFREKEKNLPKLKQEVEKWNRKLQLLQSLKERKSKIVKKKNELSWALVDKAAAALKVATEEFQKIEAKISKCRQGVDDETQKQKEIKDKKIALEKEIQEIAHEADANQELLRDLKNNFMKAKEKEKDFNKQKMDLKSQMDSKSKDATLLQTEIEKIRSKEDTEYESQKTQRDDEISRLQKDIDSYNDQLKSKQVHNMNLSSSLEAAKSQEIEVKGHILALRTKLSAKELELKTLESQKDRHVIFGDKMPQLLSLIKAQIAKFKKKPIGPIGAEIELVSSVLPEQALVIEMELKQLLCAFIVDSFEDRRVLDALQKSCQTNFPVITAKFSSTNYDINNGKCRHPHFPTVFDLLQVNNATVLNCLVDQKKIERILVIPTEKSAQELFKAVGHVPANCLMGLTHTGSQYFPAPNYRSYATDLGKNQRTILRSSIEELVFSRRNDLQELGRVIETENKRLEEAKNLVAQTIGEKNTGESVIFKLKERIKSSNMKLGQLKTDSETAKPPNVTALEEDLDRIRENLENLQKLWTASEKNVDAARKLTEEAKVLYENEKTKFQEKTDRTDPLKEELDGISARVTRCEEQKNFYNSKITEYISRSKLAQAKIEEKTNIHDQALKMAERRSPIRIEPSKSAEEIHKEICGLEESLRLQEEITETFEEATMKLEDVHRLYDGVKKQVGQIKSHINYLKTMLHMREDGFTELRKSIGRRVKMHFSLYLQTRKFSGELSFNHIDQTLEIAVSPEGEGVERRRNMKTLSGGEKSYSTISLILALWDVMNPPFRILDEFDVFMDMVNRRTALNQITDYAREARKFQYIFLTPLNTDGIQLDGDIEILRLEKNQG